MALMSSPIDTLRLSNEAANNSSILYSYRPHQCTSFFRQSKIVYIEHQTLVCSLVGTLSESLSVLTAIPKQSSSICLENLAY